MVRDEHIIDIATDRTGQSDLQEAVSDPQPAVPPRHPAHRDALHQQGR